MYPGYDSIKWFYDINCYTNGDIATYVELGCITPKQYHEITNETYPEEDEEDVEPEE